MSATLNAHGRTTGTPATWWWEYAKDKADLGTARDTEICGKETDNRCGPATSSTDAALHVSVTGLTPDTTYWFRACGQDEGGDPACGQALSFKTLAGTSYAFDRSFTIGSPSSVATDPDGNVYGISAFDREVVKFTPTGEVIRRWSHDFDLPSGISVDRDSNVFTAEFNQDRIQKFTTTGTFVRQWSGPDAFAVDTDAEGNVYVVDQGNSRVQKFTTQGVFIRMWGSNGTAPGQFKSPQGIAVDGEGNVYVSEPNPVRIQRFSVRGELLGSWGTSGSGPGQLLQAGGVATDPAGAVYVADDVNNRVTKFTATGQGLATIGPAAGQQPLDSPVDVATDKFGNVYVAELFGFSRIVKFRPVG